MCTVSKNYDVITLGEGLVVLRAPHNGLLERSRHLEILASGSEANVAVGLAQLGLSTAWISKLPNSPMARNLASQIRSTGVSTDEICWVEGGRVGIMFSEIGVSPRPNRVFYDREHSAVGCLTVDDINWSAFSDAKIFHTSGITAAIGETSRKTLEAVLQGAQAQGTKVSFDVNYRSKLWTTQEAAEFFKTAAQWMDVLFTSDDDAKMVLGVNDTNPKDAVRRIQERFAIPIVVLTLGAAGSLVWDGERFFSGDSYDVTYLNRFGGGDSFVSGFLYGLLEGDLALGVELGAAVAAYKMTLPNDNFPIFQKEDIMRLQDKKAANGPESSSHGTSYGVER